MHGRDGILLGAEDAALSGHLRDAPAYAAHGFGARRPGPDEDEPCVLVRRRRRGRQVLLEVTRDGGDVVERVAQRGEQGGYAVLPEPFGGYLRGLWGEDPDHLVESGDTRLAGERREMHEEFRTAAGGNARPERVGEGEVVDQFAGTRSARPGDLDDDLRRLFVRRSETQCVRHDVERLGAGRDENRREVQAYGGEQEPRQVFGSGRPYE